MDPTITSKQNTGSQRIVRHHEYYIHGGDIIFRVRRSVMSIVFCRIPTVTHRQVEDTLFRVHRYFFIRESAFFRSKLPHPPPPGEFTKGSSDVHPLVLEDTLEVDFERFLWVFYNPYVHSFYASLFSIVTISRKYSLYHASVEEWTSVMKLAHQWNFVAVKELALRELEQLEIPPLRKIVIYQSYGIDRRLLQAAYTTFTTRDKPVTIEEGQELGLETVVQLARARELVRAPATGGKKTRDAHSQVNLAGAELDELIRDLFQLPPPDRESGTQQNGMNSCDSNSLNGTQCEHYSPFRFALNCWHRH